MLTNIRFARSFEIVFYLLISICEIISRIEAHY
jgi:hypothetical protein